MNATSPPSSASNLEGWKPEVSPLSEGVFHRINYPENGGIRFRRFHVLPADRQLIRDSRAIDLGSRAFDILMILLDRRGAVVSRQEIQEYVWPSMIVEESNLRVQMASLRKALGPDRDLIKTIPGRGYLFVAETQALGASTREDTASSDEAARPAPARQETGVGNLSQRRPLVAVIDDDRDTREALQGLLSSVDLQVETFDSVQAFHAGGMALPLNCIVSDVWLPGQSGLELQASLKAAGCDVPLILISGHADVAMSVRAMKAGAADFFAKPVRPEEFLAAIQAAVARTCRPPPAI
ncbi:MAG TPA: response regulator [Bradyrhizobium sp.]|jgi:DNA-binding response OmpR family regulator|nr:response regulator [Bradyrhizobium sp.]